MIGVQYGSVPAELRRWIPHREVSDRKYGDRNAILPVVLMIALHRCLRTIGLLLIISPVAAWRRTPPLDSRSSFWRKLAGSIGLSSMPRKYGWTSKRLAITFQSTTFR